MYLVLKSLNNIEYRVYPYGSDDISGTIVYKGHKLGVDSSLLEQIIDFRIERIGKIYFPKYDRVESELTMMDANLWDVGRVDSFDVDLFESWESFLLKMKFKFGNITKIVITKNNI